MRFASGRAQVEVDLARGGRLASLVVDGHELLVTSADDTLGWGCYPMAPWAGRVRDGVIEVDGVRHRLAIREGQQHALHGTVLDREWVQQDERSWATDLDPWPWSGRAVASLDLDDDGLALTLELRSDDRPFRATIGWHPWFRRVLDDGTELVAEIEPTAAWAVDDDLLPTGEVVDAPPLPWDTPFTGMHRPPRLHWPGAVDLTVHADARCWVVHTPTHAVCVEPQTHRPDALGLADIDVVTPDHPLRIDLQLRW